MAEHVVDRDVEQRLLIAAVDRSGLGLRIVDRDVELEHLRDRERQDALELAALVAAHPHPAGRRARDVGRLEPQHRGGVRLEVGQPRDRRQLVGVRYAEHRARLLCRERAKPDPVGQVRLQAAEPALLEPLRGEQQVQPERAAQPADRDEEVDELRFRREHLGELVDHDEQRRQRLEGFARGAGLLVVADRGEVACLAEQLLAPHHLAAQGVLHAVDQGELLGEVGDHRRDVRQLGHPGERRAALEVDQHHVEVLGRVRHRQPQHQRAQELRLAGPGRADHQAVRAHALLGGLLDVEVYDGAAVAGADRHPQSVASRPLLPGLLGLEAVHVAERQQLHEVGVAAGLRVAAVDHATDRVQRGEPPREGLGGGQRAVVDLGPDHLVAQPQRLHRVAAVHELVALELEPEPGRVLELVPAQREVEDGHAVHAVRGHGVVAGRQLGAVDDEQDVRGGRPLLGAEPGSFAQVGGQHRRQLVQGRGHHPPRPDRIGLLGALAVGQPLDPVPVGEVLLGGQHGDDEVLGRVERGRGADHRPGQRAGRLLGAADLDPVEGAQVDRRRQVRLQPVYDEQPVQRGGGGRVHLVDGGALRRLQLERERLVAHAVADVQEPRVAAPVFPDPGAVLGDGGQRGRVGVVPGERPALLVGGLAGELADAAEVAEVLGAGAGDLLDPLLALPVDLDHDEAEGGEQEHARRDVLAAAGVGAAHRRNEHDRAERAEHRDRVHQHAAGALGLLDLRRWLQLELAVGQLRLVEPAAPQGAGARSGGLSGRPGGGQRRRETAAGRRCDARHRWPVRRRHRNPLSTRFDPSMIGVPPNGGTTLPRAHESGWAGPARSTDDGGGGADGGRQAAGPRHTVALTVHGPSGALDLVVPPEASADDVAREYAAKAGLQFAPTLHSRLGQALDAGSSLADLGIRSGDVLAAGGAVRRHAGDRVAEESGRCAAGRLLGHVVHGRRGGRSAGRRGSGRGPAGWTATRAG